MKNSIGLIAVAALLIFAATEAQAEMSNTDLAVAGGVGAIGVADVAVAVTEAAGPAIGGTAMFIGNGFVAPLGLTYLVANQIDPWHPLVCALFGDDGRVGNETTSHCTHP